MPNACAAAAQRPPAAPLEAPLHNAYSLDHLSPGLPSSLGLPVGVQTSRRARAEAPRTSEASSGQAPRLAPFQTLLACQALLQRPRPAQQRRAAMGSLGDEDLLLDVELPGVGLLDDLQVRWAELAAGGRCTHPFQYVRAPPHTHSASPRPPLQLDCGLDGSQLPPGLDDGLGLGVSGGAAGAHPAASDLLESLQLDAFALPGSCGSHGSPSGSGTDSPVALLPPTDLAALAAAPGPSQRPRRSGGASPATSESENRGAGAARGRSGSPASAATAQRAGGGAAAPSAGVQQYATEDEKRLVRGACHARCCAM